MIKFVRRHFGSSPPLQSVADFHLRMVGVGTGVGWVTIVVTTIALLVNGPDETGSGTGVILGLLAAAAVLNAVAYSIPWSDLILQHGGQTIFYVWSLVLIVFCALAVFFSPSVNRELYLLYFPVILFIVATLDYRGQAVMGVLAMLSYTLAVQVTVVLSHSELFFRLVSMALVAFLGGYITSDQRRTSLENARLYEESHRAHEELRRVFNRFGKALASSLDLEKTLQLIADLAVEIVSADAAMLVLLDPPTSEEGLEAASGSRQVELRRLHREAGEWLVSGILRSRAALQIPNLAADARIGEFSADLGAVSGSYLGVPLLLRGRVVGAMAVLRAAPGRYPINEVELISAFANQAAVGIENARLFATLQESLRELSGLQDISLAFASLTKLEDTYGLLVENIARLLDASRCVILLPDEHEHLLAAQAPAFGLTPDQVQTMRISINQQSAAARVWLSGRPYLSGDAQTDPRNLHQWVTAFGDRSLVIVPMRAEGKTVGLLRASSHHANHFANNDVRLLSIFATQAAVVLRNAMLYREVAHQRARLEAIFANASDGIMIVDQKGIILAFNQAMELLSGWQAGEAIGTSCAQICSPLGEHGESLCSVLCPISEDAFRAPVPPHVDTRIATKDGAVRDVGVSYSFLTSPEGDLNGVAIMRDISKAKELERVKSQFISTVSHELRTPLASIKAAIGLLLASMPGSTAEPLMRLLHNIDRSARRLESLVSDLLDLTRLESGRVSLNPRRLDLRDVANAAAATIRPLVEEKGQHLELELPVQPCYATGDRHRLEQVLINLLSNANKYTPGGGTVAIRLARPEVIKGAPSSPPVQELAPDNGLAWWFVVADNGPGIRREEQEHVFERFYRADDPEIQSNVGSGLGLPIAKALVELHGGHIWLESTPGVGSRFYFSLPEEARLEDSGG